jgi:hypothetical protein
MGICGKIISQIYKFVTQALDLITRMQNSKETLNKAGYINQKNTLSVKEINERS